jgi:hypothetical protein
MEKFIVSRFESEQDARAAGLRPGLEEWFRGQPLAVRAGQHEGRLAAYFDEVSELARRLMCAFAVALDLDDDWFEDKIDQHFSNLAANHYPPQDRPPAPGQLRIAPHTDTGSLTLIRRTDRRAASRYSTLRAVNGCPCHPSRTRSS